MSSVAKYFEIILLEKIFRGYKTTVSNTVLFSETQFIQIYSSAAGKRFYSSAQVLMYNSVRRSLSVKYNRLPRATAFTLLVDKGIRWLKY